ncbi:hypothetical protein HXX76_011745 [Chlamydomonas incerta]|uniref:Uncharacterized protein n=1 Tax=Chlamydomonas incerta TaxID=51695 RepID=A0A835SFZ9_CHLIN|nr:hypothetical protein HXX76_011745 [Chlamydomonas incerta]|eukprot:KAG2426518.1 hypothetical protein HXX76_011745 [Chlamydomonas incerta]
MEDTQELFPWNRLAPELVQRVASAAGPGDLRLVNKETAKCLNDPVYKVIQLAAEPQRSWPDGRLKLHRAATPWPGEFFVCHWGRPEPWRSLTLRQRRRLLCLATASGDEASLEMALAHCGCSLEAEVFAAAAGAGHLAACERLLREGCGWGAAVPAAAAAAGHLPVLQWLYRQDCPMEDEHEDAGDAACRAGHAHITEFMIEAGIVPLAPHLPMVGDPDDDEPQQQLLGCAMNAAEGGHCELLDRLAPHVPPDARGQVLTQIAFGCPLPVLERYCQRWRAFEPPQDHFDDGSDGDGSDGDSDLAEGGLDEDGVAQLLWAAFGAATPDWAAKADYVCLRSAQPGRLGQQGIAELMKCGAVVFDGMEDTVVDQVQPYHWAARHADYEQRLRWLAARGVAPHDWAAQGAAGWGNLTALRYLTEEVGLRATPEVMTAAIRGGHAHVVEWLFAHGGALASARDLVSAAECSHSAAVFWAVARALERQEQAVKPQSQKKKRQKKEPVVGPLQHGLGRADGIGCGTSVLRYLHARQLLELDLAAVADEVAANPLVAALQNDNLAVASYLLHSCGALGVKLPPIGQLVREDRFGAVRWWLQHRLADGQPQGEGQSEAQRLESERLRQLQLRARRDWQVRRDADEGEEDEDEDAEGDPTRQLLPSGPMTEQDWCMVLACVRRQMGFLSTLHRQPHWDWLKQTYVESPAAAATVPVPGAPAAAAGAVVAGAAAAAGGGPDALVAQRMAQLAQLEMSAARDAGARMERLLRQHALGGSDDDDDMSDDEGDDDDSDDSDDRDDNE